MVNQSWPTQLIYTLSKPLVNVVSPCHIIEGGNNKKKQPGYGANVLRLWVARRCLLLLLPDRSERLFDCSVQGSCSNTAPFGGGRIEESAQLQTWFGERNQQRGQGKLHVDL